jgi:hypothetical protein
MKELLAKHKVFWTKKHLLVEVALGLLFLAIGIFATYYANIYTTVHASNAVTDIILDNIPVVNVDFVFNEGALIFYAVVALIVFYEPRRIPFVLKSIALFILIRSVFMVLTHIGPPPYHSYLDPQDLTFKLSSGDDLFFSAHTGMPFMLAFVFWEKKYLRYFFFVCSAIGATAVLLGHLHYSIDVFSAFFIAFGIFCIAKEIFKKDYELLRSGTVS